MGKVLVGIFAIFLLFGAFFVSISDGIKGWRTEDTTETFLVTTPAAATTANVTFSYDLYQAALPEIKSLTSSIGTDTPVGTLYTEASKVLLVSGLDDDNSRVLTINYNAETNDAGMRVVGPFLVFLIIGGIVGLIFWSMFKKGKGR